MRRFSLFEEFAGPVTGELVFKHGSHNQKDHAGRSGGAREVQVSDVDSAWDAVLTSEARALDDRQKAHPERYNPSGQRDYGLKDGATETRIVKQEGPPRIRDYETNTSAGLTMTEAMNVEGSLGAAASGYGKPLVPVAESRPPQHVYRVMSTQEFDAARERGYIRSDERMNLASGEGTVTSLRSTGSFYAPVDGSDYRVVRIKYADEDGWRTDLTDGYIKTQDRVPFDRVDVFTSPISQVVTKHGSHDQSSHGRRGGGVSPASEAARQAEEDMNYIMGRTIFPPAWSGPAMTTFVPKRSLGDRVDSARRRIRQWKKERGKRELARMSPAELERLGAANRAREAARREALTPVAKTVDGVYEILQRLLGDVVEPSLWVELINDPRPIADLDGPLGDLVDEMLGAATPVSAVVKFAPGLRPVLKHGSHNQKDHAGKTGANGNTTADTGPVGSLDGVPFGSDYISEMNSYIQEPNPPAVLYHVAPKSARADILRNGLDPADRTWNTGAGADDEYRDEHLWMKDENGEDFAYDYRPKGIYMFPSVERANQYAEGNNGDVYRIDTKANRREIIRDPSVAGNWDYLDPEYDHAYVTRYVEPSALTLLGPIEKHLSGQHDQKTHGRGTQQSLPGTEGAGPGPAGKFTEWGDRAKEIEYMAGQGMSSDELNATLNPDPDSFDADLVREEVESEYMWEIDQKVEERMSRTLLMEDEDEVEATRLEYREEAIDQFVDDYGDEVRQRMAGEEFDSDKAIQDFQEVYGVYHEGITKDGRTVALMADVTEAWGPQGGDNSIDIKGQISDADTGAYVGRFHRRFETDRFGRVTVSHELLQIEDEDYQGTGFAKTFNRQAENYYISHGIDTVHVHAALDGGGYAWASQGFDWDYGNHDKSRSNMNRRLDLYERSVPNIPDNLRRDMARLRTRLNDLSVTDPDYPTPNEIANLGRIDGVDTWPGKMIMRGSNWYGSKHLTPSGARQSTTERAAASRRRAQEDYEAERAPGRGQMTMDRDFLEGALSQATTATTPLFPPIPGVVE